MSFTEIFLSDVALTVFACTGLVLYLAKHLRLLLIELCGTADRADFWLAFSNVAMVVVPLIFALDYRLDFGPDKPVVFEIAAQFKYALVGFIATLGALALILFRFIPRERPSLANPR